MCLEVRDSVWLEAVILDASSVNRVDAFAEVAPMEILHDDLGRRIRFALTTVKDPVREVMARSGVFSHRGSKNVFFVVDDAKRALMEESDDVLGKVHSGTHTMFVALVSEWVSS